MASFLLWLSAQPYVCVVTGQLFPVFLEDRLLVIEQLLGEVRYSQTRMRERLSPLVSGLVVSPSGNNNFQHDV